MRLRNIQFMLCAAASPACAACVKATPAPTPAAAAAPKTTKSQAPKIWRTNFAEAQKEAQRLDRPMLVHFFATWCGPCKSMDAETLNSPELARQLENRVIAVKIDSDRNLELVERYDIQSLPADLFLEPDGRIIMRSTAYQPKGDYLAHLARAEARWKQTQSLKIAKSRIPNKAPAKSQSGPVAPQQGPAPQPKPAQPAVAKSDYVGLDGFSPVTLALEKKWVKGNARFPGTHRDIVYHMTSAEELNEFSQDPDRYVPRLLGCDPVLLWKTDRAFRGAAKFGVFYNSELYLFATEESRAEFKQRPERYSRARQVLHHNEIESEESRRAAIEPETSPH